MSESGCNPMHRREFIQAGAAATAAATVLTRSAEATQAQVAGKKTESSKTAGLPRRVLGKTGVEVTILNEGTWRAPGSLDRLLRHAYSRGVRYFDTAAWYGTEDRFKKWFAADARGPQGDLPGHQRPCRGTARDAQAGSIMRLAALGTDYIDLLFFPRPGQQARSTGPGARR